jgi:hypothetical protein
MVEMACTEKIEFRAWGGGNKTATPVCEQTRGSFKNMFGRDYVREGVAGEGEDGGYHGDKGPRRGEGRRVRSTNPS